MARLPKCGSDEGSWGHVLNEFLSQSHNPDGTLKTISKSSIDGLESSLAATAQKTHNHTVSDITDVSSTGESLIKSTDAASARQIISAAPLASPTFTGTVTIPEPVSDSNPATKSYVDAKTSAVFIDVKKYGAKGDGSTDDTSAIQDALDAASDAGGGTVFLPAGTYIIDPSASINLHEGSTMIGVGKESILRVKPNSNVLNNIVKAESVSRVTLKDFTIDGNRDNQDPSDAVAVHYGVYLADSNDSRVENVYIHHTTGVGVHIYDCTGTVITGCESSYNRYHGFECEQDTSTVWHGNRGHHNSRHGIFISPGEVGGTGSIGNTITANVFDNNSSYGIAFGIDAVGGSIGLTRENVIANNSVLRNAEYGISIYRVDDALITGNLVAENGFFGIYIYRSERNQIIGNRFRRNSQANGGAYDEILIEGANDGQASQHNIVSNNFVYMDGTVKARFGIREATTGDGPNIIQGNYIPNAGTAGRTQIQHPNTHYSVISDTPQENTESLRTFDKGVAVAPNSALPGSTMGIDAPFGTAALRMFNDNSGGNLQLVAPNGNLDVYTGGNNVLSVTSTRVIAQSGFRIANSHTPSSSSDSGEAGDIAWDSNYVYVCVATNTWKRSALGSW